MRKEDTREDEVLSLTEEKGGQLPLYGLPGDIQP
jgi:hypothetical protein